MNTYGIQLLHSTVLYINVYIYIGTLPIATKKALLFFCILAIAITESPSNQFIEDMIIEIVFNVLVMMNLKNPI